MRTAFIRTLEELASQDERIHLVVGDLGYSVIENFRSRFPDRFTNAGVAEQNMTGIAAGMALCGKIVFTYSIANFPTLRCLEQIRNDVCYHKANVKVVAVGGGLAYGTLGISHYGSEDIAILRSLPNMVVVAPGDPIEAKLATEAIVEHSGPCYLRLAKAGEPTIHAEDVEFRLGKAILVREGSDVTLISTGAMLLNAVQAADQLGASGISTRVLSMHTIKPLDEEAVLEAARETAAIFTIEEHSIMGGLGGAVAEILAEATGPKVLFKRLGLPPVFPEVIGKQSFMHELFGLTPDAIAKAVDGVMEKSRG